LTPPLEGGCVLTNGKGDDGMTVPAGKNVLTFTPPIPAHEYDLSRTRKNP